jgi:type 1 glutamine amidotransferase
MTRNRLNVPLLAAVSAAVLAASTMGAIGAQQAPVPGAGAGPQGGRGGRGGVGPGVFTAADTNKDGSVTRGELLSTLEKWFVESDTAKTGAITQDQLLTALNAALPQPAPGGGRGNANCGGQSANPQTPCPDDVARMMAALPAAAPAKPAKPRKVLVLAATRGFVHSSIPLAAATVEALGNKTKAWTTTITYNAGDITAENLKQYDAVFLDSTTGCFLDDPADKAATDARRAALLSFVRSGKGLAGVHAATDSYHASCTPPAGRGGGRGGGPATQLAGQIVTQADKNGDQRVSLVELGAVADAWFEKLDTDKAGRVSQADFAARFASALPQPAPGGGRGPGAPATAAGGGGTRTAVRDWPEFNTAIGGMFLAHPFQHVWVKVEDPKHPITAAFKGQTFEMTDETYTMQRDVYSRANLRVLLSIDVSKMTPDEAARENRPWDHDYALSWVRREGKGRVFYSAHGHNEAVYAMTPMLEHYLAGIQYAIGDLKADDSPSMKSGTK